MSRGSAFRDSDLEAKLVEAKPLLQMATAILDRAGQTRRAVIFTAGFAHAHMLAAMPM